MKKSIVAFSIILMMVVLVGCNTSKSVQSKEGLTSSAWELSLIKGNAVTSADFPNGLPDAIFTSDNKVSGHGGCNHYGGTYTLDAEGKLTLSQLISTKMFCEGVKEDDYLKALALANMAKIEGNNLVLYFENEALLVFVPKKL